MSQISDLQKPFHDNEIEWRVQMCGKTQESRIWALLVPYPDSRRIMERLDEVLGVHNWHDEYRVNDKGVICRLTINADGKVISKEDGADFTGNSPLKGAMTNAFKRVAVKFNIGNIRALYGIGDILAKEIRTDYPPRNEHVIKIIDRNKGIRAWCYPPKVSEILNKKSKTEIKIEENGNVGIGEKVNGFSDEELDYPLDQGELF